MVLVEPFVHQYEVESPFVVVAKQTDQHCMEEVGLQQLTEDTGNSIKHVESLVNRVP